METDGGGRRTLARRYGICKHASALYSNGGTFWAVPCSQQIFPPRTIGSVAFFGGGAPAHGSASFPLLHHAVSMPRSSSSQEGRMAQRSDRARPEPVHSRRPFQVIFEILQQLSAKFHHHVSILSYSIETFLNSAFFETIYWDP